MDTSNTSNTSKTSKTSNTSNTSKKYLNANKEPLLRKYKRLLSIYAASCEDISQKQNIPYAYYVRHLRRLIVLLQFIHQIYRITFKKNMPQINMFDALTMRRYADAERTFADFVYFSAPITQDNIITRINDMNISPIAYYNYNLPANPQYILKFSHSMSQSYGGNRRDIRGGHSGYEEYNEKILYSTILHRAIRITFKANKIAFNGEPEIKYTDDTTYHLAYSKYMSILPSHITLNIVDFVEDDKDIIPFFGDNIRGLLRSINQLHANFREDYEITSDNHGYEKQLSDIKGYSDDDTIRTILYTINNNNGNLANIYKDKGEPAYYYWFRYNSPLPAITILDTHTYISGIHTFQPFYITPARLLSITQYYIGSQEPYSRVVNSALQNYIANGVVMERAAYKRVRYLLKFCADAKHNPEHNKRPIYVFHGTHKDFHSSQGSLGSHTKDLVLTSFLSCTFNISIALRYAFENIRNNGSVYILEIKDGIDYINFNDDLYQIILQPSTRIKVENTLVVGGVKYNLCKVYNTPKEYMEVLYSNIFEGGKKRLYNIKHFKIYSGKSAYPMAIARDALGDASSGSISSVCLGAQINEDIIPNSYFNVKYTLHQHFICDCYKFFNINVVDYSIYYDAASGSALGSGSGFYSGYNNDPTYEPITTRSRDYGRFNYNFDNLFIDSLLLNEDALYPQNYMKNTKKRFEYRLSSLRATGLFDYEGYKKINFNAVAADAADHKYLDIIKEYISRNEDKSSLFINDITRDYMRMCISNNIPYLRDFRDRFVDMLRDNYIDFIGTNMRIDDTTEEYEDLVGMFRELAAYLKNTAEYYVVNMENGNIYKEVEPFIYDATTTTTAAAAKATGGKLGTLSKRKIVMTAAKAKAAKAATTKEAKAIASIIPHRAPSVPITDNNNKGYVMPYDDFVKIIDKFRIANNK
jgi:hypothetical protein